MGQVGVADFERIKAISFDIESIPLFVDDTSGITFPELAARARRLKRQRKLDILIIDYVQLLAANRSHSYFEPNDEVSIGVQLKALAAELDVPVVGLSQVEVTSNKPPELKDLDEGLRSSCDVAMFVYREARWLEDKKPEPGSDEYDQWQLRLAAVRDRADLVIAKHRGGSTGVVHLRFDEPIRRFRNL